MTLLLCGIFFFSGAAALLFETLWFQQAGLALGNSIWASSLVMAGFMGGLALGNGLAARFGRHIKNPIRLYAIMEGVIALTGVALVYGLPASSPIVARLLQPVLEYPWIQHGIRLGVGFLVLLIPSTAMGVTLPLLVKELFARDARFGRALGRLYGWNTLGAVAGALIGHALMTSPVGIRGSAWIAASTNVMAAIAALGVGRFYHSTTEHSAAKALSKRPAESRSTSLDRRVMWLLAAAALSGAIMLALEVVWFRFLLLFVHGTSLTFSVMLAVVLAGIGLGGLVGGRWLGANPDADRHIVLVSCLSGAMAIATYVGFGWISTGLMRLGILQYSTTLGYAIPLMFPCAFLSGVLFTMLGQAVQRKLEGDIRPAGLVTLWNTVGAMLGSLIGGFVLLPFFGVERTLQLLASLYGVVALMVLVGTQRLRHRLSLAVIAGLVAVAFLLPGGSMDGYLKRVLAPYVARGGTPIAIREGLTETSILLAQKRFGQVGSYKLLTNSFSMSMTRLHARRYMKAFVYWPVAVHPNPKRALLISYGVGATAQALVDTDALESIDVVDISKDILSLSATIYSDPNRDPLRDPRVNVHIEDGRHFLETRFQGYDIITGEPPPPKIAGITNLYTREYFETIQERLNEGGIVTYWLPVHGLLESETKAILRAFCDVFDDCSLWNGASLDWMMIGTRSAKAKVTAEHFSRQWRDPRVIPELRALGIEEPEQLGALFMADADDLRELTRETLPLTDDHPGRLGETVVGPNEMLPIYRDWIDTRVNRKRFAESSMIERVWPAELKESTIDYFEWQQIAVAYLTNQLESATRIVPTLDRLQRRTSLQTLPLWVLGSTEEHQNQKWKALAAGQSGADLARQDRLLAMAMGDYRLAAEVPLSLVQNPVDWYLRIYALYRTGDLESARKALARTPKKLRQDELERYLSKLITSPWKPKR